MARLLLTLDVNYRDTSPIQNAGALLEIAAMIHQNVAGLYELESGATVSVLITEAKLETKQEREIPGGIL